MPHCQGLAWRTLAPVLLFCPPQLLSLQLAEPVASNNSSLTNSISPKHAALSEEAEEEPLEARLALLGICYPSPRNGYLQGDADLRWCRERLFPESLGPLLHRAVIPAVIHQLLGMHDLGTMRVTQWVGNTTRSRKASNELLMKDPRNPFAAAPAALSREEIGRLMSHRRAMEYMVKAGHQLGLVLDGVGMEEGHDGSLVSRIDGILRNASSYDGDWDLLRLSDCPGACRHEEAGSAENSTPGSSSSFGLHHARLPRCARAYIVSARGARKFLANSMPIITTVDHLIALLDRRRLMAAYDPVDPPIQPLLIPDSSGILDVLPGNSSYCPLDPSFDVWYERQVMEAEYRPLLTGEVPALRGVRKSRQWKTVSQHCSLISQANRSGAGKPDNKTLEVLRYMKRLDLKGFLVYDFRNRIHSHAFIHEAVYGAFREIAAFSRTPLHVCWLEPPELNAVSITQTLGYSARNKFRQWRGRLGSSLVMASPKHMSWSKDPAVALLPRDPTSRYVFHDFVPEHFGPLRDQGLALQWVVFGRDGGQPRLESVNWLTQQRFPWKLTLADLPEVPPMACDGPVCSDLASRTYVAPWATALLPRQINASMDLKGRLTVSPRSRSTHVRRLAASGTWIGNTSRNASGNTSWAAASGSWIRNTSRNASGNASWGACSEDQLLLLRFVGSVWSGNNDQMYKFISGCHKARVLVSGNGWQGIQEFLDPEYFLGGSRINTSELQRLLLSGEHFAPAIQGSAHLLGNFSYIPDRLLTMAASGRLLGSNNPAAAKFFAPYKEAMVIRSEGELCDAYVEALEAPPSPGREAAVRGLMSHIAEKHTYASRFKDLLEMFASAQFGTSSAA